jgi:hypothetical protein
VKASEVSRLLGFIKLFDDRVSNGDENVLAWAEVLPPDLELELAVAAVKAFYRAPAEQFEPKMTTRQLMRFVRQVKSERRTQERRAQAVEATQKARQLGRSRQPLQIGGMGIRLKSPEDA